MLEPNIFLSHEAYSLLALVWGGEKKNPLILFGLFYVVSRASLVDQSIFWKAVQSLKSNSVTWMESFIQNHNWKYLMGKAETII